MTKLNFLDTPGLLEELSEYRPKVEIINFLRVNEDIFDQWKSGKKRLSHQYERALVYYCMHKDLGDILEYYVSGLPSYNQFSSFSFDDLPLGYSSPISSPTTLKVLPTTIADQDIGFPIGVPASVLTGTSRWVEFYAKRGFDILTYKTVRTLPWDVHPKPNIAFIPKHHPVRNLSDFDKPFLADPEYIPDDNREITLANSFGIPSQSPDEWQEDVQKSKSILRDNQILIVSVTGTTLPEKISFDYLVNDFVKAASMAREAGADAIELNLSCPNVKGHQEGYIYRYPEETKQVVQAVWKEATGKGRVPLFIKIGYLEAETLSEVVGEISNYVAGIVAINTISAPIYNITNGEPFFPSDKNNGIDRSTAGVSGAAIREFAKEVVRNLTSLREKEHYEFDILAVGGVYNSKHLQDYLDLGANAVLSCTGALINPNLAFETRQKIGYKPNANYPAYTIHHQENEREVIEMTKEKSKIDEDVLPDIEPGYGRRKPTPISNPKDLIEEVIRKSKLPILRDLLRESEGDNRESEARK